MPASAESKTNLVNVALDALVRENLLTVDEQLRLGVNLDAMVSQPLHDFSHFRAL